MTTESIPPSPNTAGAALQLKFYSHATLDCRDGEATRRFFEEFLGLETARLTDKSFAARLGGAQTIVVVENPNRKTGMPFFNHNGLDVGTPAEVDQAYEVVKRDAQKWGLKKITRPLPQHGTYSFYFWDLDDNAWEILSNPDGGYSWAFEHSEQEVAQVKREVRPPAPATIPED